ncbi:MAG: hypothetical protein AAB960_02035 [Patescibacteria group bacterium]
MFNLLFTHTPLLYFVQSLWRDEAFSILAAQQSLVFIVTRLGFEPPVYYAMLHFWIKLFGSGEIAARSLSLVGFLLSTALMIEWSHTLYKKHWLSWYLPLFFFLNPMLLYYAFEVRTYGWYIFFATATLISYSAQQWKLFIVSALLGFYTHVYMLPFIGILGLHWLWTNKHAVRELPRFIKKDRGIQSFLITGALMLPWLIRIGFEASRMKTSWYYPVDLQLVRSALGNMFIGYEGTPWYGWTYTFYLSVVLLLCAWLALTNKLHRKQTQLFILFGVVPLAVVIAISFIKPLFVNRYLIPTTIAEILVVVAALSAIHHKSIQKIAAALVLCAVLWVNWWYPPQHAKAPIRNSFDQINVIAQPDDIFLAADSIIYLETLYYARDASRVYLYNPRNNVFPWYIGDALITPSRMIRDFPLYPMRAILVHPDTSYEIVYRLPI